MGFDPTPSFLGCLPYGSLSIFTSSISPLSIFLSWFKSITFSLNIFALETNSHPVPLLCQTSGNSSCNLSPHPYISLTLYSTIQCHYPMAFGFSKAPNNLLITKFNDFSLGLTFVFLSSESSSDLLSFPWNLFLHWLLESYSTHPLQTSPIIPAHCFCFLFFTPPLQHLLFFKCSPISSCDLKLRPNFTSSSVVLLNYLILFLIFACLCLFPKEINCKFKYRHVSAFILYKVIACSYIHRNVVVGLHCILLDFSLFF